MQHNKGPACGSEWGLVLLLFKVAHVCHAGAVDLLLIILTNKSTASQIIYSVPQMRFTWLAKPSRFHMVCETMKRFTWFVKPCEIRTIKPVKFFRVPIKPCEITDPYGSLRSDVTVKVL